ncbi:hypothetical protein B296_00041300 [Ensete ventricosum]|uniref:Uncharacterized protein n=1 Tax=Ensete ventricosum TaxID=4639 RepID=A0A426YCQ6_ENSVE|nr:hypothetical protein B296_00041300 [Ensete ventricosum]
MAVRKEKGAKAPRPPIGKPALGAAACSAVPTGVATYNATPTSSDRLRAQCPWAGLRTRWSHKVASPARRGCRSKAVAPGRGQRRRRHSEGEGGLGHLFKIKMVMPLKM